MKERLSQLLRQMNLGELLGEPVDVQGGYLHRMFRVEASSGVYAVKALNPDIMRRPAALGNMIRGEQTAKKASRLGFGACAAIGSGVEEVGGAYYLVYPWVEGASVFPPEITAEHCRIMGDVLGKIHAAGLQVEGMPREHHLRPGYDWAAYADAREAAAWDQQVLCAQAQLLDTQVISHRDLDPKNVLWQGMVPCIIDWEAAGYVNPWQELVELLNYWADDQIKVQAMLEAYGRHRDLRAAPWEAALLAGMDGMLGWLHYNLRRRAGEEGTSPADREEGAAHVASTLAELRSYARRMNDLRQWVKM